MDQQKQHESSDVTPTADEQTVVKGDNLEVEFELIRTQTNLLERSGFLLYDAIQNGMFGSSMSVRETLLVNNVEILQIIGEISPESIFRCNSKPVHELLGLLCRLISEEEGLFSSTDTLEDALATVKQRYCDNVRMLELAPAKK